MINEWPRLYFSFWYFYSTAEKSELGCLQQNGPALRLPARKSQSTIFSWWSFWTGFSQRSPFFLPSKTAWAAATSESTYPPNEPFISPSPSAALLCISHLLHAPTDLWAWKTEQRGPDFLCLFLYLLKFGLYLNFTMHRTKVSCKLISVRSRRAMENVFFILLDKTELRKIRTNALTVSPGQKGLWDNALEYYLLSFY